MATIVEMRKQLVENGYDNDEVIKMKKSELEEELLRVEETKTILDSAIETGSIGTTFQDSKTDNSPKPTDPKWTDYVLSLFTKDELENDKPKVDGLRRVAELLYGPFNSYTQVVQTPTIDNAGRATVIVSVDFLNRHTRTDGAADVYSGNTDKKFSVHAVATAETRAEGRALRKALKLTKVLSAEESHNAESDEPTGNDGRIVSGMLNGLKLMCDRQNVDLVKLATYMGFAIQVPEDLTSKQGLDISNKLSKFSRKDEVIPDNVKR